MHSRAPWRDKCVQARAKGLRRITPAAMGAWSVVGKSMAKTSRLCAGAQRSDPIDRGYFARFTRGNAKLEREVLELFCAQMPISLKRLRAARSGCDWRDAAHTIKGSASAIGAWRLAGMAELAR